MSPEKKSKLDKELQALYESCFADGLTPAEIRHVAGPFVSSSTEKKRALPRRRLVKKAIACTAVVLFLLLVRESIEWRLSMYGRLFLIALLPYWDWTPYHYATCLVANPLYKARTVTTTDCQVCEDLRGVARADGVDTQALLEQYVENLVPLVVRESMGDWPSSMTSFALTNVTQAYLDDEDLKAAAICNFRSNRHRMGFDSFLRSLPTASGWFAHWESCDHSGQKHLRQFYRRPSFLPLAVELTRPNWVIASQGFSGRRFKQLEFEAGSTLVWLAQVKGLNYIRLAPEAVCSDICQELELLLDARDILLVHTNMWKVHYLPGEDSENIAFAAGGFISE
ncbi:uncharacterized protein LOC119445251 [Dermacentor silvarum]|uniref:uncharacterized protein LOC119445251 n=1 Tax=Dermacentor silvarum TaxID=543639 RepID=UPI002100824A|nr:uncharacterized protein LOC119445251 [Dermacentor silvarum]